MEIRGHHLSIPVLQGGMGVGVSLGGLAGAVAACGGMGTISTADAGYQEPDFPTDPAGANLRALKGGVTTDKIFALVEELRKDVTIPLVFMTYANVVFSYGTDRFLARAAEVGVDGIILPDVPYEEKEEFAAPCRAHGLDFISLIAPTSEHRIAAIAREAEGFLYLVSSLGVTGTRSKITTDLGSIVNAVRENTQVPCAIGFGISTPEQAGQMAQLADGVIVGSAIVKLLEQYGTQAPQHIAAYVKSMKEAM